MELNSKSPSGHVFVDVDVEAMEASNNSATNGTNGHAASGGESVPK